MKRKRVLILAGTLGFTGLVLTYGHTAVISLRLRSALASSEAVSLETFDATLIQKRVLSTSDAQEIIHAFPVGPQFPVPLITRMCFVPHHRIVILDTEGRRADYEICFHCDQYSFPGTGVRDMPGDWPARTRQLFARFGLPLDTKEAEIYLVSFGSAQGKTIATGYVALPRALPKDGTVRARFRLHDRSLDANGEASGHFQQLFRGRREGECEWTIHANATDPAAQVLDFMPGLADANISARVPHLKDGKTKGEWFYATFSGGNVGGTFEIQKEQ